MSGRDPLLFIIIVETLTVGGNITGTDKNGSPMLY